MRRVFTISRAGSILRRNYCTIIAKLTPGMQGMVREQHIEERLLRSHADRLGGTVYFLYGSDGNGLCTAVSVTCKTTGEAERVRNEINAYVNEHQ